MNHQVVLEAEFGNIEDAEAFANELRDLLPTRRQWTGVCSIGVVPAPPPITDPSNE